MKARPVGHGEAVSEPFLAGCAGFSADDGSCAVFGPDADDETSRDSSLSAAELMQ